MDMFQNIEIMTFDRHHTFHASHLKVETDRKVRLQLADEPRKRSLPIRADTDVSLPERG